MQEQSHNPYNREDGTSSFRDTRVENAPPDLFDPNEPRLGRRESEPHSAEVSYLFDVLKANFKDDRVMWDLHHYFISEGTKIDLQFDISYFRNLEINYSLSSYRALRFQNKVPTMVINILSKSTWMADVGKHVDYCKLLKIPIYIVFPAYHVAAAIYKPPFLRAYILQPSGEYLIKELRELTLIEEGKINEDAIIDISEIVPFRLGLLKRKQKHEGDLPLYRLVIINSKKLDIFPSKYEKEVVRADEEKNRADIAEQTISKLKKKIKNLEK